MKHIMLIIAIASLTISTGYTQEYKENGFRQGQGRRGKMGWLKKLNLTEEQVERLHAIRSKRKGGRKEHRQQMKKLRQDLQKALQNENKSDSYDATLRGLHNKILEERSKKAKNRFETMLQMRKILTPEQMKKFRGMKGKRGKRGGMKRHRRGRRRNQGQGDWN